jgi:phosphatidate cytidylyltransferase
MASDGAPEPGWLASELGQRVASGIVMIAVALAAAVWGGWPFALFWLLAALAILVEWLTMAGVAPRRPLRLALGGALVAFGLGYLLGLPLLSGGALAAAGLAAFLLARSGPDRGWALAGFACAAVIALVPPAVRDHPALGLAAILWMFAVVWTTDIAAYFTGRGLGGPKLWPAVSPKKTWSGFLGGLCVGTAAGVAVAALAQRAGAGPGLGLGTVALVSAVASVLGQLGDLAESALKRHFGVKDSGSLIPGHGGVMDRLDAFWAVALLVGLLLAGWHAARG